MSISLKLGEPLIEAVKTKLQANLAARVTAINADSTLPSLDPPLATPPNANYFTAPQPVPEGQVPAIVVTQGQWARNNTGGEGPHSLLTDTEINVYVIHEHPDPNTLAKLLQRMTRAVTEALWDSDPQQKLNKADGTLLAWNLVPLRGAPSPVFDIESPNRYRQLMLTVFAVTQIEG